MSNKLKIERELLSKPGDTILETIEYMKMSQSELAGRMGKTPSKINDLISGKEPITVNTALQLEKVLAIDAKFWLNREMQYREKLTRIEQEEALEECIEWLNKQPIKELKKYGYLKTDKVGTEMVAECLQFYGVASVSQWESIYVDDYVSTSFRKSQVHQSILSSMTAWLRIGEIEMRKIKNIADYDKDAFKQSLTGIRRLVKDHPEDFATRLQQECLMAGVIVIYVMCISKAPISGAARWIGKTPLIQLTDRYKSNDHFWFTFYHEAGHLLLHGRKEVFIEDFDEFKSDPDKETEADEFANKWLLPGDVTEEVSLQPTEKEIKQVARKYQTHPAIVLGRLQHLKIVPFSFGVSLKLKVVLDDVINKGSS
jgi:addiction module HigA family antidote